MCLTASLASLNTNEFPRELVWVFFSPMWKVWLTQPENLKDKRMFSSHGYHQFSLLEGFYAVQRNGKYFQIKLWVFFSWLLFQPSIVIFDNHYTLEDILLSTLFLRASFCLQWKCNIYADLKALQGIRVWTPASFILPVGSQGEFDRGKPLIDMHPVASTHKCICVQKKRETSPISHSAG